VDVPAGVAAEIDLTIRRYADPRVKRLVTAVQAEYVVRYGGPDEAVVDDAEFDPPTGLFLLGICGGQAVAMGGWRRLEANVAEIKRMFVLEGMRGRGFARAVLAELERTARAAGIGCVVLNTGIHQPEAIGLYESTGYTPIEGFGYYADYPNARFYGKKL
jgi:GNAT superfamily N-acetyltransferase